MHTQVSVVVMMAEKVECHRVQLGQWSQMPHSWCDHEGLRLLACKDAELWSKY